ncbi:SH3 domain-containing protein [Terriglobus albidus]|uniref:SH3 domain-containing protein n=1 Tax=Terriglobus albidus TaxID=1592106 RepID=A0A5B9E5W4_9BACT|nr:SH3 domain-containing protein [Terriglobus albidus]QEE27663.1 SH3 domain-containing protein [Terriglobus albidus]
MIFPSFQRRLFALAAAFALLSGCSRLRPKPKDEYVYVTAKGTYLRDRLAAVSNRTGNVDNGQKLKILERQRHYFRVVTDKGETGWINERAVVTQDIVDQFEALKKEYARQPAVASGVVRDDVYLHLKPGRDTDRFYRLNEGEKLGLIARATLPKPVPGGVPQQQAKEGEPPAPPPMEDWWMVRSGDRSGWLLSRMMDVDVPDSVARYAEGQRIVGNYVLTKVEDDEVEGTDKMVPIFVTLMNSWKAGLPYDFDQVRVFTWNRAKHRYETAFRDRNIQGFLPVEVKTDPGQPNAPRSSASTLPAPSFIYRVLAADNGPVIPDPVTGISKPSKLVQKTYRLEGNITRRVLRPGETPQAEAKASEDVATKAAAKKPAKKRK